METNVCMENGIRTLITQYANFKIKNNQVTVNVGLLNPIPQPKYILKDLETNLLQQS